MRALLGGSRRAAAAEPDGRDAALLQPEPTVLAPSGVEASQESQLGTTARSGEGEPAAFKLAVVGAFGLALEAGRDGSPQWLRCTAATRPPRNSFVTQPARHRGDPMWNETFVLMAVPGSVIEFQVLAGSAGSPALVSAEMEARDDGGSDQELPLRSSAGEGPEGGPPGPEGSGARAGPVLLVRLRQVDGPPPLEQALLAMQEVACAARAAAEGPLQSRRQAEVCLTIVRATNLPSKDVAGLSDPYCVVRAQGVKEDCGLFRTKAIPRNLNPEWNHQMILTESISSPFGCTLILEVWDNDNMSTDDASGTATFTLGPPAPADDTFEFQVPLIGNDAGEATLFLKLTGARPPQAHRSRDEVVAVQEECRALWRECQELEAAAAAPARTSPALTRDRCRS